MILDRILEHKKAELRHKSSRGYLADLKTRIRDAGPTLGFAVTLDARRTAAVLTNLGAVGQPVVNGTVSVWLRIEASVFEDDACAALEAAAGDPVCEPALRAFIARGLGMGVVITYQAGEPLRAFGANVLVVNLVAVTMLREMGPLLAAIIVAGRTGSAYTA